MGQKVHPVGFRIGITKKHQANWFSRFSKYKYSQSLLEDQILRKTLTTTLNNLFLNEGVLSKNLDTGSNFSKNMPVITNITIERNLIPYQITIGIHATNCNLFKEKLFKLPFNSEFKSQIKTASTALTRAQYLMDNFKITKKKKTNKKINIKKNRFNKRKKILSIYNEKLAKQFIIVKKENEIIQSLLLRKNPSKGTFKNQILVSKKSKLTGKTQLMLKNQQKTILQKDDLKNSRFLSFRREFFIQGFKKDKVTKILLKKKFYLSKNKKHLTTTLSKQKTTKNSLITLNKNFKNSSKNIINLRKTIIKRILKNSSKNSKNSSNILVNFNKFKTYPILRVRRVFYKFKNEIKRYFFEKKNKQIKLKKNFSLRMKKKFIKIYLKQIHFEFTSKLLENYNAWYNQMVQKKNLSPYSILKKWGFNRSPVFYMFLKTFKNLSERKQFSLNQEDLINVSKEVNKIQSLLVPVQKVLSILKRKIAFKFKALKKEFIAFGKISETDCFPFYQVLYYFNNLKKIVSEFEKINNRQLLLSKFDRNNNIDKYIANILLPFVKNKQTLNKTIDKKIKFIKNKKEFNKPKNIFNNIKNKTTLINPMSSNLNNLLLLNELRKKQPKLRSLAQILTHLKKIQMTINPLNSIGNNTLFNDKLVSRKLKKKQTKLMKNQTKLKSLNNTLTNLKKQKVEQEDTAKKQKLNIKIRKVQLLMKNMQQEYSSGLQKLNIQIKIRRMKFITYLKDIIKKHRKKNLYFYLPIIAETRKKIRENNMLLQIKAKKFFGQEIDSLIQENIKIKKDTVKTLGETDKQLILKIKKKLTPSIDKILKQNYRLKIQKKETANLLKLRSILEEQLRLREILKFKSKIKINFFNVNKNNFLSKASSVSQSIVDALEKRKSFRQVIKNAQKKLMKKKNCVKGVKIQVAGRLNGAEIARTEWIRGGQVPLQTLSSNIDYSYRTASTIYGIIGVKVWIFKGYAKLLNH